MTSTATRSEITKGLAPKPAPFVVSVLKVYLLPLRGSDRVELVQWLRSHEANPKLDAISYHAKLAALALCDESGALLLTDSEVSALDLAVVQQIGAEVLRRNGLDGGRGTTRLIGPDPAPGRLSRLTLNGCPLLLRRLTAEDKSAFDDWRRERPARRSNSPAVDLWTAAKCIVNDRGRSIFDGPHELADCDGSAIAAVCQAVMKITGIK